MAFWKEQEKPKEDIGNYYKNVVGQCLKQDRMSVVTRYEKEKLKPVGELQLFAYIVGPAIAEKRELF